MRAEYFFAGFRRQLARTTAFKSVNLLFHLILGYPQFLLEQSFELLSSALHLIQLVIRELTPFLSDLTLYLLPIAFHGVYSYTFWLLVRSRCRLSEARPGNIANLAEEIQRASSNQVGSGWVISDEHCERPDSSQ